MNTNVSIHIHQNDDITIATRDIKDHDAVALGIGGNTVYLHDAEHALAIVHAAAEAATLLNEKLRVAIEWEDQS